MNNPLGWTIAALLITVLVLLVIYLTPRLISAALHRSRWEAEHRNQMKKESKDD
ncbi:hypothetical protein LCGC14_2886220 [marine sediment metagenome]|uniref:Uncharacterized protein n=1 Tax=marine sediment metagenome TaxID=412755 RepID=A0A0F8XYL3_9ZZZZ